MKLKLVTASLSGKCTLGVLYLNGKEILKSVERDWLDNKANISCIPAGTYTLTPHNSPKFGKVYALENKELGVSISGSTQRTHILIHSANYASQLQGCIALGTTFADKFGVGNSRKAMAIFESLLDLENNKIHELEIVRAVI